MNTCAKDGLQVLCSPQAATGTFNSSFSANDLTFQTLIVLLVLSRLDYRNSECVPIQLAQCWFPGLAIFDAKIKIYFSNKMYGSNFIKQHSETVMV